MSVSFAFQPPRRNVGLLMHLATDAAEDAIVSALLDASQPLVPVEESVLKASGRTGRGETGAYVTYGRDDDGTAKHAPSNQYAVIQEVDDSLHHPNGGQAHFLETPMHAAHEVMLGAAAVELKPVFE